MPIVCSVNWSRFAWEISKNAAWILGAYFSILKNFALKQKEDWYHSQEAMEYVQHDFLGTRNKYKISRSRTSYETNLLRAVCEYNAHTFRYTNIINCLK